MTNNIKIKENRKSYQLEQIINEFFKKKKKQYWR